MDFVSRTHIGLRRSENQDRTICEKLNDETLFLSVFDGMGGENAGAIASEMASKAFFERVKNGFRSGFDANSIRNLLMTSLNAANIIVNTAANSDEVLNGMGTTCVAAIICSGSCHIINIGDSRAYILGSDGMKLITTDHTVVRMLYEKGEIKAEEMNLHPKRNYMTRAVGVADTAQPDYFEVRCTPQSRLLLCSDGLSGYGCDEKIEELLKKGTIDEAADSLMQLALDLGGRDNITVAIAGN